MFFQLKIPFMKADGISTLFNSFYYTQKKKFCKEKNSL